MEINLVELSKVEAAIETTFKKVMAQVDKKKGDSPKQLIEQVKYGNAKESGKRFGVHPNTIRNWNKAGYFKKYPIAGISLYSFEEIEGFIKSRGN